MKKELLARVLSLALLAAGAPPEMALAEDAQTPAQTPEATVSPEPAPPTLEQRINDLEQRVAALESAAAEPAGAAVEAPVQCYAICTAYWRKSGNISHEHQVTGRDKREIAARIRVEQQCQTPRGGAFRKELGPITCGQ